MTILLLFAFLAGIVTVLSPCVLPVLPALLSAGAGRGHLRPIGIISGVVTSFTTFTLFLTGLVHLTGISSNFLRMLAILLISAFGVMMIFPSLSEKFAKATSQVANLGQNVQSKSALFGSGFWSGFVLGIALGLVWTPCAGPILAAITTLVATSSVSWSTFFITFSYSLGAAIPMFLIIYGGKKIISSSRVLSHYSEGIRIGFGVLMILAALTIALHYDVKLQQFAIQYIPFINIEDNPSVQKELTKLKISGSSQYNKEFMLPSHDALSKTYIPMPELIGIVDWINTKPLTQEDLIGKVVLVDFWTYSCINCIRTLPYLKNWYAKYKNMGLVIIGVHTPEFEFEKKTKNVEEAVKRFEILYPVAVDSNFKTWQNFNNFYWPAHYLFNQNGRLIDYHFGEGAYIETENDIRSLLGLPPLILEKQVAPRAITPETYLGYNRAESYSPNIILKHNETALYSDNQHLGPDQVSLKEKWFVGAQKIISKDSHSEISLNFLATKVYLVMEAMEETPVTVTLDGNPLPKHYYTQDMVDHGQVIVKEPRKYDVLDLKGDYGRHIVELKVPEGVFLYVFTFGDD